VQIQDLVGCRIVVPDVIDQDLWKNALVRAFPDSLLVDRRVTAQYGYRAVHLIVREGIKRYEIQIRTTFQDEWANIVEKIDDRFGFLLKYGESEPGIAQRLKQVSDGFAKLEAFQRQFEARLVVPHELFPKMMIATYLVDYDRALEEAYPADQRRADEEAWNAYHSSVDSSTQGLRGIPAKSFYIFSDAYRSASEKAEAHASRFLRSVLWSSVELPLGTTVSLGPKPGERVEVLERNPVEPSNVGTIAAPTLDDLKGGYIYEIVQPKDPGPYWLSEDTFRDMLSDEAGGDLRELARQLNLEEWWP